MKTPRPKQNEKTRKLEKRSPSITENLNSVLAAIAGSTEMILESAGDDFNLRIHASRILRASRDGVALLQGLNAAQDGPDVKKASTKKKLPSSKKKKH